MNKYTASIVSALIATITLSILMLLKNMMGLMPDVDIIAMLSLQMGNNPLLGWMAHFMIGALGYGLSFALIFSQLKMGNMVIRGVLLGIVGWVIMMVMVMPMMGAGFFGLQMPSGIMVPIMTLMLHIIFGAVLGLSYSKFMHIK